VFLGLEKEYQDFQNIFSEYSQNYFSDMKKTSPDILWQSMKYSFDSGGKRFRPFLAYLVSKTYGIDSKKIMSVALACEFIHTYSLIHDDLPCMDNDDFRRGLPTNHKKFGEDIALLAGDALQSEAIQCLASDSENSADQIIKVINIFSNLIGTSGMIAGQVLDMKSNSETNLQQLENIHRRKTGDLISAAVVCAAIFCQVNDMENIKIFSENLGLAFQIKDDLLDGLDGAQDHKSYLKILGEEKTIEKLKAHSDLAMNAVSSDFFRKVIQFNVNRVK
jgi:geranylgeranyl diphosphate synthase, type II